MNAGGIGTRPPSATAAGMSWIAEFDEADRGTAALLLDSLEIQDQAVVETQVRELIRKLVVDQKGAPAVLIPVQSLEDLPPLVKGTGGHVAYETFNPGDALPVLSGSESIVGAMIRELIAWHGDQFIEPTASIDQLKVMKVRKILLVTDYCGTGTQALRFAKTFKANTTIASWISYKKIELEVVAFAASADAVKLFETEKSVSLSTRVFGKSASTAGWSFDERSKIESFCRKYAGSDSQGLGYKGSFGLFLTNRRVPNNLPDVLIDKTVRPTPLFAGREFPESLMNQLSGGRYLVRTPRETLLRNIGAPAVAAALDQQTRPLRGASALAVMTLINAGVDEDYAFAIIENDHASAQRLKATLISLALLSLDGVLTRKGEKELKFATRKLLGHRKHNYVSPPSVEYVPTQLR